ncbi:MAG: SMP-30/gluconolactonase/LRE family protein [Pirellulaceae bacterium]|nr:SMP-30/gluconolactonase/LRE family protein [Pirellulaceae bacterium]
MVTALLLAAVVAAQPADAEQLALLKTFRDEFVLITPGQGRYPAAYRRGRGQGGEDRERPAMQVTLPGNFYIARYEVPQNLWESVMGSNPSRWKGPRNSVEMLSFAEAVAFCERVTQLLRTAGLIRADQQVRLPSESEWEYVARAGTTTTYSFGDDVAQLDDYAWHTGNAAGNDPPVGAKRPNAWGLYDIHGYLWEWCLDHGHASYAGAPTDGSAWTQNGDDGQRVARGGSWKDKAERLTSSYRHLLPAETRDDALGLRCVLTASREAGPQVGGFLPSAQEQFVPAGARLEVLWNEGQFTEGPALAPDGTIAFTDIGESIMRLDPATGEVTVLRRPSGKANGLMYDRQGRLVACEGAMGGNRRLSITTGDGQVRTLADRWQGKRFNSPNDLAIHPGGDVYFTDPRYAGEEPRELDFEGVFVVRPDGDVRLATRDVERPNGILISADGQTAYVADNNNQPGGKRQLLAFQIADDGTLASKQVLFDFGGDRRGIDGMTLDVEGNLYATAGRGDEAGIYVFSPRGSHLAFVATPGDPTNCVFGGGEDSRTLYITGQGPPPAEAGRERPYALYRIRLAKPGYHLPAE